jgi:ABC-2 type transport system ATP-binding protein
MKPISVQGLKKNFGRTSALNGVNFEVSEGEVFGFIGPNGAGKSTTIRILLGLIRATGGTAQIFGKDVWQDAVEIHKRIAYVPGEVNLWPNLSGGEVIELFMRMKGTGCRKQRDDLARKFNFDSTKKCGTYSKGNKQKVALISAFSSDADLLILDEPTSGLDPLMEIVFRDCVKEAVGKGKTVFLSSHILSEVEQLCDRISIIRMGNIIDTGTLNELRHISRNQVSVESADALSELESMDGVYSVVRSGQTTSFSIDNGKTGKLIRYLATKNITRLVSTPPSLEDLFIHHYS